MIITITGKPCSGKGTVSKQFCQKYGFEYICTGDIFRDAAKKFNVNNITKFNQDEHIKQIDTMVDNTTIDIGKTRSDENIVFDSRLAWHFIPNSFKVFIDVELTEAGRRLLNAKRDTEETKNLTQAKAKLKSRWDIENERYTATYGVNNTDLKKYDLVISSTKKTVSEIVEIIHKKYTEYLSSANAMQGKTK